jgi:hypothetical protein
MYGIYNFRIHKSDNIPPWPKFKNVDIKNELPINVSLGVVDLNVKLRRP